MVRRTEHMLPLLLAVAMPASLLQEPAAPPQDPAQAAIQESLEAWVGSGAAPGASMALSFADGRTWTFVAGLADQESGQAMQPSDYLLSGSIGKTYFAALFLDLVAEERMAPEQKLAQWLGEEAWYAALPNAADITLEQLLQHTSGVPEHVNLEEFWEDVRAQPEKHWRPQELVAYILEADPHFAPGEGWSYADTNYILLGMAMEKALGESVYREVHRRFLLPLGLENTRPSTSPDLPGLVQGYHILGEQGWEEPRPVLHGGKMELNPQLEWCGGGYYSTTADLARWARLLFTGKAAPMEQVQASLDRAVPARLMPGDRYAYGVIVSETSLGPAWGHQGWFPGYLSEVLYFPQHGVAIALQINTDDVRRSGPLRPQLVAAVQRVLEAEAKRGD